MSLCQVLIDQIGEGRHVTITMKESS